MALINCPECGKEISEKASTCPHCGYPINEDAEIENNNNSVLMNDEENIENHYDESIIAASSRDEKSNKKTIGILISVFAIIVIALGAFFSIRYVESRNNKILVKSGKLARETKYEEALECVDKVWFDEEAKQRQRNEIVVASYLCDCKREMEKYDINLFKKWFTDDGECHLYKCEFYETPVLNDYKDYPHCVLSALDRKDHEYHYLYFNYDATKGKYVPHDEVIGLEQDNSPDKDYSLDSDIKDAFWYNLNKGYQNALRTVIDSVYEIGDKIDILEYTMDYYVDNGEAYQNAPLLDGYSTYQKRLGMS